MHVKKENQLIWESYLSENLKNFIDSENSTYVKVTGTAIPSVDKYPLAKQVSNNPLVQQYVATRLAYYGGGENKLAAAKQWAAEALSNPIPLD
jgi:hypothetical protein